MREKVRELRMLYITCTYVHVNYLYPITKQTLLLLAKNYQRKKVDQSNNRFLPIFTIKTENEKSKLILSMTFTIC